MGLAALTASGLCNPAGEKAAGTSPWASASPPLPWECETLTKLEENNSMFLLQKAEGTPLSLDQLQPNSEVGLTRAMEHTGGRWHDVGEPVNISHRLSTLSPASP